MKTVQRPRRFGWALLVVAVGMLPVGCSSTEPSGSSTLVSPSPSADAAAACADAAELKSSVQTLAGVEPLQDGLNALEAASSDTKAALETAVASVTAELQPVVDQVKTEITSVQTAMDGLTTDNLTEKAPELATALRRLKISLSSLAATLSQKCPEP